MLYIPDVIVYRKIDAWQKWFISPTRLIQRFHSTWLYGRAQMPPRSLTLYCLGWSHFALGSVETMPDEEKSTFWATHAGLHAERIIVILKPDIHSSNYAALNVLSNDDDLRWITRWGELLCQRRNITTFRYVFILPFGFSKLKIKLQTKNKTILKRIKFNRIIISKLKYSF